MVNKDFTQYTEALELKQLGFDEPCFAYYLAGGIRFKEYKDSQNKNSAFYNNTVCSIPLYQQAFRWFRENYNLISSIDTIIYGCTLNEQEFHYKIITNTGFGSYGQFGTYEEAEFACLEKLIEIVESKLK